MSFEVEPMQQPIRRIVGRPLDPRNILTRLHHLQLFARNITQNRELIREGASGHCYELTGFSTKIAWQGAVSAPRRVGQREAGGGVRTPQPYPLLSAVRSTGVPNSVRMRLIREGGYFPVRKSVRRPDRFDVDFAAPLRRRSRAKPTGG